MLQLICRRITARRSRPSISRACACRCCGRERLGRNRLYAPFFFPLLRASVSEHADGERRPIPFSERPWPGPFASSFGPFFPGEFPPFVSFEPWHAL